MNSTYCIRCNNCNAATPQRCKPEEAVQDYHALGWATIGLCAYCPRCLNTVLALYVSAPEANYFAQFTGDQAGESQGVMSSPTPKQTVTVKQAYDARYDLNAPIAHYDGKPVAKIFPQDGSTTGEFVVYVLGYEHPLSLLGSHELEALPPQP